MLIFLEVVGTLRETVALPLFQTEVAEKINAQLFRQKELFVLYVSFFCLQGKPSAFTLFQSYVTLVEYKKINLKF